MDRQAWQEYETNLNRTVGMRELRGLLNRALLPAEAAQVVRSAKASGIAFQHYRIDLNGPTQGEPVLIEEWHPES